VAGSGVGGGECDVMALDRNGKCFAFECKYTKAAPYIDQEQYDCMERWLDHKAEVFLAWRRPMCIWLFVPWEFLRQTPKGKYTITLKEAEQLGFSLKFTSSRLENNTTPIEAKGI
jgi:Holliday junction resolvase